MISKITAPPDWAIEHAVQEALDSSCFKSKRGAVIWGPDWRETAGTVFVGHNDKPSGCGKTDVCKTTCSRACLHAEQAAIIQMLRAGYKSRPGLQMLHVKVENGVLVEGGPPSCDQCSKLILASGIADMWLYETGKGWVRRSAWEFHVETWINVLKEWSYGV